jgi:pSer/pThr/pTyr-binding forkhead associated (FHA) protein
MDWLLFALRVLMAAALVAFLVIALRAALQRTSRTLSPLRLTIQHGAREQQLNLVSETLIGRDPNCVVHIDDAFVSARHARVFWQDGWRIADLASHNGTFLNDVRLTEAALTSGDVIRVGGAMITFTVSA